jgi:hypothetical protein
MSSSKKIFFDLVGVDKAMNDNKILRCKSCEKILTVELLLVDRLGCDPSDLRICTNCLHGAIAEILMNEKYAAECRIRSAASSQAVKE